MKSIYTGKGSISLLTLIAIWSISLVVDLPGLAITPVMSNLDIIFPHATHLEIQMLSVLPNFVIIPFILLSGKLSMSRSKMGLIYLGMAIFLLSGIACFLARSMVSLIIISCFIGVGCGLVIPLAAGVIADFFSGPQRMQQMGIKSGIANFSLIFCTLLVGWISGRDWHLPFVVYLMPVIPLLLAPFLTDKYLKRTAKGNVLAPVAPHPASPSQTAGTTAPQTGITARTPLQKARASASTRRRAVWGIMGFYFAITICSITVSYYMPFLMQEYKMPDSDTGTLMSVFFLFVTLAGFLLSPGVRLLRNATTPVCMALMTGGLLVIAVSHTLWLYLLAVVAVGFGYGMLQPIFYNKASLLAPTSDQATLIISFIMTANYLGTAVTPLFFTGLKDVFHASGHTFTFWLSAGILIVVAAIAAFNRHNFVFYVDTKEE